MKKNDEISTPLPQMEPAETYDTHSQGKYWCKDKTDNIKVKKI